LNKKGVQLVNSVSGEELWSFRGGTRPEFPVVVARNASVVALVYADCKIVLREGGTGKFLRTLQGPVEWISPVCFSDDGRVLFVWDTDGVLHSWDVATGQHRKRSCEKLPGWRRVAVAPDGRLAAVDGHDVRENGRQILLVSTATGKTLRRIRWTYGPEVIGHTWELPLVFSPDGRCLAWAGPQDGVIHVAETATGGERCRFVGHRGTVVCLSFAPDGKSLVSGSTDTTALVWDLTSALHPPARRRPD
jgi:WD40 repeat protein